jgi:hypothetical protein
MSEQQQQKEQLTSRLQALHRYTCAIESGDIETLALILHEAGHDPALERMILELNEVYQQEEHTAVQPAEIARFQRLLYDTEMVYQTTLAEEYLPPLLHDYHHTDPANVLAVEQSVAHIGDKQTVSSVLPTRKEVPSVSLLKRTTMQVFEPRKLAPRKWYQLRRNWFVAGLAACLITLLLLPSTGALAQQFLSIFRIQQFQVVQITKQDVSQLKNATMPTLNDLGTVSYQPNSFKMQQKLTQAQAAQLVNFSIQLPSTLPQGIMNEPTFGVIGSGHGTFTFDTKKARNYLSKNNYSNVQVPANLDGATYDLTSSAGLLIAYNGTNGEGKQLIIAKIPSPIVSATGKATLEDLRSFFLSLPNLPPEIVTQLQQINLSNGTVPIFVPPGCFKSYRESIHGTKGVVVSCSDVVASSAENMRNFPLGSVVLWQLHGLVYAVGGVVSNVDQLLAVSSSVE